MSGSCCDDCGGSGGCADSVALFAAVRTARGISSEGSESVSELATGHAFRDMESIITIGSPSFGTTFSFVCSLGPLPLLLFPSLISLSPFALIPRCIPGCLR